MPDGDLEQATDRLCAAFLLEDGVAGGMAAFAAAHGATGTLLFSTGPSRENRILETPSISEPVAEYLAGDRPVDTRDTRVQVGPWRGFAADLDDFTPDEIARDPYYQEFLRPHDLQWHACAWVDGDDGHELVLSLKRSPAQGHFERREIERLDSQLGTLRTTFRLKKLLGNWRTQSVETVLERTDRGVAWLNAQGGVIAASRLFQELTSGVVVLGSERVRTVSPAQQSRYDAALRAALGGHRSGHVVLADAIGRLTLMRFLFVGSDLSSFLDTGAVLAIATPLQPRTEPPPHAIPMIAELFGLTLMEARVAALVACGWAVSDSATRLKIGVGTARNYLKAAFSKTNVSRQVELATLLRPIVAD